MANNEFIKVGDNIVAKPKGCDYDLINGKVYDLSYDRMMGTTQFKENGELNMPKKVYQTKKDIIFKNRVFKYFNKTDANTTGIMLAGTKGTGKTMMAKVIAKESNLPIIVVDANFPESKLLPFFKKFSTPVCIILDEVEKNFRLENMLTFLDGIEKTAKKMILMTCNNLGEISEFTKDRCSRIRYMRNYKCEDNLEFLPTLLDEFEIKNKQEVLDFCIKNIKIPSIDNLISFLTEIKLNEDDSDVTLVDIIKYMNISTKTPLEEKSTISIENTDSTESVSDNNDKVLSASDDDDDDDYDDDCDETLESSLITDFLI